MSTDAQTMLDSVNAAIAALLQGGVEEYQLSNGFRVRHTDIEKLYRMRTQLQGEVVTAANGGSVTRLYGTRGNILS